jgi:uncharacterized protein YqeY
MAQLLEGINEDLKEALKSGNSTSVSALRFLISKLNNAKIEKGSDLTDEEILSEIEKDAKKHKESIDAFEKAGRGELAAKEKAELEVLAKYLPEQMSDEELLAVVEDIVSSQEAKGPSVFGSVMSQVMAQVKGKADGGRVSAIVKQKLNG